MGPALRRADGKLVGQILERLNGRSCSKVLAKGKADVHYIRALMLEVQHSVLRPFALKPSTRICFVLGLCQQQHPLDKGVAGAHCIHAIVLGARLLSLSAG